MPQILITDSVFEKLKAMPMFAELDKQVQAGGNGGGLTRPPQIREAPRDVWSDDYYRFWKFLENPAYILRKEEPGKGIQRLHEMAEKDSEIGTALIDRARALCAMDWDVLPGVENDAQAAQVSDLFRRDLIESHITDLILAYGNLPYYGYSIAEIFWTWKKDHWGFDRLCQVPQWAWKFDKDMNPLLLQLGKGDYQGTPVTPGRFLVARNPDPVDGTNPYGLAEGCLCYYPGRWKNWAMRQWLNAAAKVGGLNGIGTFPTAATDTQQAALLSALDNIQNGQSSTIPENYKIEFPDFGRMSIGNFFTAMINYFDQSIRKVLLGASLGNSESSGTGTYAQAKVHSDVSDKWLEGSAKLVEQAIDKLARQWTDYNYGPDIPAPRFSMDYEKREDAAIMTTNIKTLIESGIPLDAQEVYERTGWKKPETGAEVIKRTVSAPTFPSPIVPPVPQFSEPDDYKKKVNFIEGEQTTRQRREVEREVLIGKIISDGNEAYKPFMDDLQAQVSAAKNARAVNKITISGKAKEAFQRWLMDALGSAYVLSAEQLVRSITKPQFAEDESMQVGEAVYEDFGPWEAAVRHLRQKAPVLSAEYYSQMKEELHHWSFTVSNLESTASIQAVQESLIGALARGETFQTWKADIVNVLSTGEIEALRPGQLETVFRTNIMTAYAAADEQTINEADPNGDLFDSYRYFTSQTDTVCEICAPRDNMIFPREDTESMPPLHFNCACTIGWVSKVEGEAITPADARAGLLPPIAGFESSPGERMRAGPPK